MAHPSLCHLKPAILAERLVGQEVCGHGKVSSTNCHRSNDYDHLQQVQVSPRCKHALYEPQSYCQLRSTYVVF